MYRELWTLVSCLKNKLTTFASQISIDLEYIISFVSQNLTLSRFKFQFAQDPRPKFQLTGDSHTKFQLTGVRVSSFNWLEVRVPSFNWPQVDPKFQLTGYYSCHRKYWNSGTRSIRHYPFSRNPLYWGSALARGPSEPTPAGIMCFWIDYVLFDFLHQTISGYLMFSYVFLISWKSALPV